MDDLNTDYIGGLDGQTSIVSDLMGGAVASVADFGVSVFNSLVPESYEASTADLLRNVSSNALRVYNEHPDAVKTASFVGGMFVPAGLAVKGLNTLRAGAKGASWFATEQRAANLVKLEELAAAGPAKTEAFKALRRQIHMNDLANIGVDVAVGEAAMVMAMNDHPFMEDYLDDPVKNFGLSMAVGGVIGGGITHIASRAAVRAAEGRAQAGALAPILDAIKPVPEGMPSVTSLTVRQANIDALEKMSKSVDKEGSLLTDYASKMLVKERTLQEQEFQGLVSGMKDMPEDYMAELKNMLYTDPRFEGLDAVKPFIVKESVAGKSVKGLKIDKDFGDLYEVEVGTGKEVSKARILIPEADGFGTIADVNSLGRATAMGVTESSLVKSSSGVIGKHITPDQDAGLAIRGASSPVVDKMYAERLAALDQVKAKYITEAAIAPDDLPTMNGLIARVRKERELDPTAYSDTKFTVTRQQPVYTDSQIAQVYKTGGVAPTHAEDLKALGSDANFGKYDFELNGISAGAKALLSDWRLAKDMTRIRLAMNSYLRPSQYIAEHADARFAKEIYEHPASVAFRNELAKLSDTGTIDGHVYLARGMKGEARGSNIIESFGLGMDKAAQHGTAKLYKVAVKDVIGTFKDTPDKDGIRRVEVLVGSPARQTEATLPIGIQGEMVTLSKAAAKQSSTQQVSFDELVGMYQSSKEEQIQSFMREGRSSLEVSIRTNTPKETIEKWAANGYTGPLSTYGADSSYSTASMLSEYLHPRTQPLKVSSNIRQKSWADMQSSLDRRSMDIMNDQIIKTYFERNANTPLVKAIYDLLHTDEMDKVKELARMDLNKVTNANAGTKWIQTSDFWAKNMGNFGAVMAYLGKHVEDIGNHAMNRMLQPISKHLEAVALDKAATVEMNLAKQVYDSTPGYALYKDRQWYTKVERTVEVNGKATKKIVLEPVKYQGEAFIVKSDAVDEVLKGFHSIGRELYSTKGTVNGILGRAAMHDRGTWMPSINPRDKHLGYVVNHAEGTTKLLWGNTAEELEKAVIAYKSVNQELIDNKTMQIFTKAQQADYSLYNGRLDTMTMEIANVEKFHKGSSATAIVKNTTDLFGELIGGIEHSVQSNVRQLVEISLHDISANLRRMSEINQVYSANQPLSKVLKGIHQPQDAAKNARNMMLGLKDLPDYTSWDNLNTGFEATTGLLLNKITDVWNTVKGKTGGIFSKNKPVDYEEYKRLAAEAGMVDPYAGFGEAAEQFYSLGGLQADKNQVRRIISTANNFAATSALKFAEIAHPLVNAMSLPILMTAGIADKMPANFLGASLKGKINPLEAMANGVRAMNSGKFNHWEKIWVERGYLDSTVSEATKVLKIPREFDPGIIAATERALDSKFVEFFSKGANWSEQLVRKTAMHTGAQMAKRLYPDLSDTGVTIFARNFMDKVVGNYHASQRPVFFQGTMGTALGLFQTYMLTFGQNMYRQLELKNYKALGKTMLAQGTIFGARSMPGFQPISEMIGEHYSDDHTDLMSGTIRAVDDDLAKAILFGLPSSMGPAIYTRGELTPRVTTPLDLTGIPAVNMVGQTVGAIGRVAQAVAVDGESMPRAIGQALSLQSVSRPLARMSELATGTSITAAGNTVQTPDEVWSTTGVIARVLGTRPTEEAILRESDMVRRVYDSYDREARQKVLKKLKLYVRDGNLTEENMAELAADYLDEGGTPRGWQSAINQAILEAQTGMLPSVRDKLKPNNSLNHVIDMLDD